LASSSRRCREPRIAASGVLTDDNAKVDVGHRHRGGPDLSSMSGILADTAYRLLLA